MSMFLENIQKQISSALRAQSRHRTENWIRASLSTWSSNQWKYCENVWKNDPKIDENGGLWGSGRLHFAPGGQLGAKMAPKIAKRRLKRRQDGQHGAKMGQHGFKMGSKSAPKSCKSIDLFFFSLIAFLVEFWRDLGTNIDEKSIQK